MNDTESTTTLGATSPSAPAQVDVTVTPEPVSFSVETKELDPNAEIFVSDAGEGSLDEEITVSNENLDEVITGAIEELKKGDDQIPPFQPLVEGKIKLTIQTGGETYECMTDDIPGAIKALNLRTTNTRTIIRAEYDGRVWEKTYFVAYARRIFFQNIAQLMLEKTIRTALNV